jgi:hypothetical protein
MHHRLHQIIERADQGTQTSDLVKSLLGIFLETSVASQFFSAGLNQMNKGVVHFVQLSLKEGD